MVWEAIAGVVKGLSDTVKGIIEEFHIDPEKAIELKQKLELAIMDHQRAMWQLEISDKDSARKREVETKDPTTRRLAYLYTGGYFGVFTLLISGVLTIQADVKQLVDVLMAVLTAGQYSILAYYFGSSHGSSQKDVTLDRVVNHRG